MSPKSGHKLRILRQLLWSLSHQQSPIGLIFSESFEPQLNLLRLYNATCT